MEDKLNRDIVIYNPGELNDDVRMELHVYSQEGTLLKSDYDVKGWELKPLEGNDVNYNIVLDIHNNIRDLGFYSGVYTIKYFFVRDMVLDCFIDQISSSRTEISFKLKNNKSKNKRYLKDFYGLIDYNKSPTYGTTGKYIEPSINFYTEDNLQILHWIPVSDLSGLLKFYEPLQQEIEEKTDFRIILPLSDHHEDKIILYPPGPSIDINILRPSDFNIKTSFKSKPMNLKSWNEIVSSDYDLSTKILNKYFGKNVDGIELNVDYRSFDNYIFYSSAADRLDVFKYKLGLIEGYDSSLSELQSIVTGSASSSLSFLNNIKKYEVRRDTVIKGFDSYEKYLYFESSSYESSSLGEYYSTSWPKSNSTTPYVLYSTSSSEAVAWYDGVYDSASLYDNDNNNSLKRTIPEHIREDEISSKFITFVSMIGHQLDTLWLYTTHLEKLRDRDESLYEGMSKDLVYHVLSSYGWDGINDMQYDDLWNYSFGTNESGSAILTGSLAVSQSMEWISAVSESVSSGDLQKEVWKRILNNLPYLNKTKGTKEGVRALINCYGIPSTELAIREYGGPEPLDNKSYNEYRKFTYSVELDPNSKITTPTPSELGTIEFRFKTDYSGVQTIYQDSTAGLLKIGINSDNSMSIEGDPGIVLSSTPVNDGSWWSFMLQHDTGNDYNVFLKKFKYGIITNAYSSSVAMNGSFPGGLSYDIGNGTSGFFSGSIQEFRLWNQPLTEAVFDNHVLAPTAYNGNSPTSSYTDLWFRLPLGTDTMKYNHSVTTTLDSQHPNYYNTQTATFTGFSDKYNYLPNEETYNQEWPDTSANRRISNKVRVEDNYITGSLKLDGRVETSAFDTYPLDNPKVGVYLSPTNEVDQDIAEYMGGFRVDDYIGSYENIYRNDYPELRTLRENYFRHYSGRYNTTDYFRLLNYFNTSIFKQIKEILPARAKALTGVVIEPHILNRNKVSILINRPTAENTTKETEINTYNYVSLESENMEYDLNLDVQKTGSSRYYWHDIIFVDGTPSRVENDSVLQEALQKIYEDPRSDISHRDNLSAGVKNHRYNGCKIQSANFNVDSPDTPDGSPVISFTITSDTMMRTQPPGETGNLDVK